MGPLRLATPKKSGVAPLWAKNSKFDSACHVLLAGSHIGGSFSPFTERLASESYLTSTNSYRVHSSNLHALLLPNLTYTSPVLAAVPSSCPSLTSLTLQPAETVAFDP